jgi:hypothetical protein
LEAVQCKGEKLPHSDYEQDKPHLSLANKKEQEATKVCTETHKKQCLCKQDEQHPCERNTDDLGSAHQNII